MIIFNRPSAASTAQHSLKKLLNTPVKIGFNFGGWKGIVSLLALLILPFSLSAETRYLDANKQLPWPKELEKDVQFWINIFSKVDRTQGYIHDARDLSIIYEEIDMHEDLTKKEQREYLGKRKDALRERIDAIAVVVNDVASDDESGEYVEESVLDKLDAESKRIYKLLPGNLDEEGLKEVIGNIRFQRGQADSFKGGIQRSGRWMPYIRTMMKQHGVPDDLRLLPHVESAFTPYARSHVGASGMWQFTRGTGKRFMTINKEVDERLDPYKASESAAKLLSYNYSQVQSWPLAITAYNHGLGSMKKAAAAKGKDNLVEIVREYDGARFGFASRNFYLSFLAAVYVHKNADKYFGDIEKDTFESVDILRLPNYLSIKALEDLPFGKEELQRLNPSLLKPVWTGEKYIPKNYALRVPSGELDRFFNVNKKHWHTEQLYDQYHRVKSGETLSKISKKYNIKISVLKRVNKISNSSKLYVGQRLILPGYEGSVSGRRPAKNGRYTVKKGDTLNDIANDLNLKVSQIVKWNKLASANSVYVGQKLIVNKAKASKQNKKSKAPKFEFYADNYKIFNGNEIEVLTQESWALYAKWLKVSAADLRGLNPVLSSGANSAGNAEAELGDTVELTLAKTTKSSFEKARRKHHYNIQSKFYKNNKVLGSTTYTVKDYEDPIAFIKQRYRAPMWLIQKNNPDLLLKDIVPGTRVLIPLVLRR